MMFLRGPVLVGVLVAACAAPATSPPAATATSSKPATVAAASPTIGASECTSATATTRQVIERYFALTTSNNAEAVIDCFAKMWRDKAGEGNPPTSLANFARFWANTGPARNVVITFIDAVNGCDRFRVGAQIPSIYGLGGVPPFFLVGPEAGRMRIYETGNALAIPSLATARCP